MNGEELGRRIAADPLLKPTALMLMRCICEPRQEELVHLEAPVFAGRVSKPVWEDGLRKALLALGERRSAAAGPAKPTARAN